MCSPTNTSPTQLADKCLGLRQSARSRVNNIYPSLSVAPSWLRRIQLAHHIPPLFLSYLPVETLWLTRMRHRHSSQPATQTTAALKSGAHLFPRSSTKMPGCHSSQPLSSFSLGCTYVSSGSTAWMNQFRCLKCVFGYRVVIF